MKVWSEIMSGDHCDTSRFFRLMDMACLGLLSNRSPFFTHERLRWQLPPNAWARSVVLHPDDLHGLPFREAPNRWLVTFYVMIALVSTVKIFDALCGYLEPVVSLSEAEHSD
jgi:hypothetical protein